MNQTSLQAIGIHFDYQPEIDLLFAWIGEPQRAENVEVEPGVYIRVEPSQRRVVGIEVIDCAARFRREPATIDATFAKTLIDVFSKPALDLFERSTTSRLPFSSQP